MLPFVACLAQKCVGIFVRGRSNVIRTLGEGARPRAPRMDLRRDIAKRGCRDRARLRYQSGGCQAAAGRGSDVAKWSGGKCHPEKGYVGQAAIPPGTVGQPELVPTATKRLETGSNCFTFRLLRNRDFARVA